jgi:hypothetical protein
MINPDGAFVAGTMTHSWDSLGSMRQETYIFKAAGCIQNAREAFQAEVIIFHVLISSRAALEAAEILERDDARCLKIAQFLLVFVPGIEVM